MSRSGKTPRVTLGGVLMHLLPAALLAGLFVAVGVMHVTSRVMVVDAAYRISKLEQKSRELTLSNDRLKLELATLRGPTRLEKLAREQLGMTPAHAAAVINVAPQQARLARAAGAIERREVPERRPKWVPPTHAVQNTP